MSRLQRCIAISLTFSVLSFSNGQAPTVPALTSFAVTDGSSDLIVWPQQDIASAYQVQSCSDATCASASNAAGSPTALCPTCGQWLLTYTPTGRRRLLGIGSYYRVRWTPSSGTSPLVSSSPTASQDGTGTGSSPVYADITRGSTAGGCGSWSSPCSRIQDAVTKCPVGGTVWVAPGAYSGTGNLGISFLGKPITVSSYLGAQITAITPNGAGRGFIFNTNEIFTSVLNGMTVLGGSGGTGGSGAGVLIDSAGPVISNCIFTGGVAEGDGGAIVVTNSQAINVLDPAQAYRATTSISGTTFINNTAQNGGGISITNAGLLVSNSLFEYCFATQAGAGRGGAVVANFAGILFTDVVISNCYAVFSGGALHTEAAITLGQCTGVQMINNQATSFGGAFTSFAGSNLFFTQSEFSDNVSGFYGGGLLALYGNATVTYSKINRNRSTYGGGATKALAGSLFLDNCQVANNTANAGAGTEIAGAAGYYTVVGISNSIISGNRASLQGGAFNLGSTNATTFSNVTFSDNIATSGGAGYCAGDIEPLSGSLIIAQSTFVANDAQLGGSLYATTGCIAVIQGSSFLGNTARQYGSAVVTTDYVTMTVSGTNFEGNGNSAGISPPSAGGAISIGYNQFVVGGGVSRPTNVTIASSNFTGNIATDRGGALNLQAGSLLLSDSVFISNRATAATLTDVGTGGAVSIIDACSNGNCPAASAQLRNTSFTTNFAFQAGGALYFSGSNPGSSLNYTGGVLRGNRVQYTLTERNKYGLGGALYLANNSYTLQGLTFSDNSAFLGGGLFASTNFTAGGQLQSLTYNQNNALLGYDQYWLRVKSPSAVLSCTGCSQASTSPLRTATEAVQLNFLNAPPSSVQSNEPASAFQVALQDYYGNQGLAENAGTCEIIYNGTGLTLPELGRVVDISNGSGNFQQFQVQGGIGSSFQLSVECSIDTNGQNPLLPTSESIPPIPLALSVELCPIGTEEKGVYCQPCDLNFYNYNSSTCQACPEGAQCPGGSLGLENPILTQNGYWRSTAYSANVYRCGRTVACPGYPTTTGEAYGDASCPPGSVGPLCAVCSPGSFGFGGQCKACTGDPQGKLMLSFAILLFLALIVVLFVLDFGTDLKPGVMTKIKTLLAHFQLMSLFRTYDVTWPDQTQQNLSWADTLNVGLSVAAPGCWIPHYNFYVFYLIQMALPILLVALCFAILLTTKKATSKLEAYLEEGIFQRQLPEKSAEGWHEWLLNLQTRCYKNAFWFVTLLYPRCAQTSMQMFATQTLDVGTYLKADYSIRTRTVAGNISHTYAGYLVLGTVLVILFTVIIPLFYFLVIWKLRFRLEEVSVIKRFGFLYGGYAFPYWEVADMIRKLAIAAIPVFIKVQPLGSLQAVLGEIVLVIYIFVVSYLKPFGNPHDNLLQVGSMIVLFLLLLSGESLKWAKLSTAQQHYVATAQILMTTGVAVSVLLYALCSLGFVRRGFMKVVGRFTGSNRVMPADTEDTEPKETPETANNDSLAKGMDKSIWSDSEYSSEDASFRSSSAGDFGSPRESPPISGSKSSRQRTTPNPLLLAFPVRSDQQSAGPLEDTDESSDNVTSGGFGNETSVRSKKGI